MTSEDFFPERSSIDKRKFNDEFDMETKRIAEAGRQIYETELKAGLEQTAHGKYIAINIIDHSHTIGDTPDGTIQEARRQSPDGVFYLMRVGHPAVYRINKILTHDSV